MKLSAFLAVLLASTCSLQVRAENKTRPVYLSSIAPAPLVVPGVKPAIVPVQYSKHFEQGLTFKKAGDTNRALIEFLQAIKENPRCIKAFYEQALLFRQKGYPKLAESSLCQALAVDSNYKEARILLATVRLEAGNTGGAAQELARSLGIAAAQPAQKAAALVSNATPVAPIVSTQPVNALNNIQANTQANSSMAPRAVSGQSEVHKNGLQFTPEGQSGSRVKSVSAARHVEVDTDEWAKRLKYLSVHGTGTLKPGEAYMFSEETGEAVIFLADGKRIRRIISTPQDTHELVKARRPDMLIPADLLYKLSTLGKLVAGDPAAVVDTEASQNPDLEEKRGEDDGAMEDLPAKKKVSTAGTLGDLMDRDEDTADNSWTHKAILEDSPRDHQPSPAIPHDATRGPKLDTTEPASMKDFNKDPVNDSLAEKTQKFLGWFKKALHLP